MKVLSKIKIAFDIVRIFKNWPIYFCDYLGFIKKRNIVYKDRNNTKYIIRAGTPDRLVVNDIILHKCYNKHGFEFKDDDLIIDIGAHIGIFSILASKFVRRGKIFSLEPALENFILLKNNVKINNVKNIVAINKAVSNKSGKKTLFTSSDSNVSHSFFKELSSGNKILVNTISLNDFIRKYNIKKIDFLKMDCEGAEFEILFGCSKKTLALIKKIGMEYHNIDDKKNVHKLKYFLEDNGFKINTYIKLNSTMLFASKYN